MKKTLFTLAIAFLSFLVLHTVQAQNAHFTDVVLDGLTVTGKVAGLGNKSGSVEVIFTSVVSASVDCYNPAGNLVEAHSETLLLSGGEGTFYSPGKNGQITFSITLSMETFNENFGNPCPGKNWTAKLGDESSVQTLTFQTASGSSGVFAFE
jgi:hypothetical protein